MLGNLISSTLVIFTLIIFSSLVDFGQVHNINLSNGKKTVVKGQIRAGEGNEQLYIFEAKPHQHLSVHLSSVNDNAVFSVNEQYRVDRSPIEIDGQPVENQAEEWTGELPETESNGLYSVAVTSTKGTASFTVQITLDNADSPNTNADSSSGEPENVRDYFLLLPEKYCGYTMDEKKEKLESSETNVDIERGYIVSQTERSAKHLKCSFSNRITVGYVIAYNEDGDAEASVPTKLYLLEYEAGKWTNVTTQLLPAPVNKLYNYSFLEDGNTIEVQTAKGAKLYSLHWRNSKFVKR